MTRSDHHSCRSASPHDGEGDEGGGHGGGEEVDGHLRSDKHPGGQARPSPGVVSAVVAEHHALAGDLRALGLEVREEALGGLDDDQVIHLSKPCSHPASYSSRAELETLQHDLPKLIPVAGVDEIVDLRGGAGVPVPASPAVHQADQVRHVEAGDTR